MLMPSWATIIDDTTMIINEEDMGDMRSVMLPGFVVKEERLHSTSGQWRVEFSGKAVQEIVIMHFKSLHIEIKKRVAA